MIVYTSYNGFTYVIRAMIHVVASGTLMNRTMDDGYNLIKGEALNKGQSKNVGG